jgi:hypothetical protein
MSPTRRTVPRAMSPRLPNARFVTALMATIVLGVAAACHDADPTNVDPPDPSPPLTGTYDFTARFTAFTFEVSSASSPECSRDSPYCTLQRAPGDGSLTGTLVVGDSAAALTPTMTELRDVHGTFVGRFCEFVDFITLTGCGRVGASTTYDYRSGWIAAAEPFQGSAPFLGVLTGPETGDGYVRLQTARQDADSLYGIVYWRLVGGRSPPTYTGTFVARRRAASSAR